MPANSKRKVLSLSERFSTIKAPELDSTINRPEILNPNPANSPSNNNNGSPHEQGEQTSAITVGDITTLKRNLKVSLKVNRQINTETKLSENICQSSRGKGANVPCSQEVCLTQGTESSITATESLRHSVSSSHPPETYQPSISGLVKTDKFHATEYSEQSVSSSQGTYRPSISALLKTDKLHNTETCNKRENVKEHSSAKIGKGICEFSSGNSNDSVDYNGTSMSRSNEKILPHFKELHSYRYPMASSSRKEVASSSENQKSCNLKHLAKVAASSFDQGCDENPETDRTYKSAAKCLKMEDIKLDSQNVEVPSCQNVKKSTEFSKTEINKDNVPYHSKSLSASSGHHISSQGSYKDKFASSFKTPERKRRHSENRDQKISFPTCQPRSTSKLDFRPVSTTSYKSRHKETNRDLFKSKNAQNCDQQQNEIEERKQELSKRAEFKPTVHFNAGNTNTTLPVYYSEPSEKFYNPRIALSKCSSIGYRKTQTVEQTQLRYVPAASLGDGTPESDLTKTRHKFQTPNPEIGMHSTSDTWKLSNNEQQNFDPTKLESTNPYLARFYKSNSEFSNTHMTSTQLKTDCNNSFSHIIGTLTSKSVTGFYSRNTEEDKIQSDGLKTAVSNVHSPKNDQERAQLVTTLLEQCKALVQTNEDKDALTAVVTMIKQEADPDGTKLDTHEVIDMECSNESASEAENEKNTSVAEPSITPVLHTTKKLASDTYHIKSLKFEGRTLLKGGVEPRHIPFHLKKKLGKLEPIDPRTRNYDDLYKYSVELPLPVWADEVIGAAKVKEMENGQYKWNVDMSETSVEKRVENMGKVSESMSQNKSPPENDCNLPNTVIKKDNIKQLSETLNSVEEPQDAVEIRMEHNNEIVGSESNILCSGDRIVIVSSSSDVLNKDSEIIGQPAKMFHSLEALVKENEQLIERERSNTPDLDLFDESLVENIAGSSDLLQEDDCHKTLAETSVSPEWVLTDEYHEIPKCNINSPEQQMDIGQVPDDKGSDENVAGHIGIEMDRNVIKTDELSINRHLVDDEECKHHNVDGWEELKTPDANDENPEAMPSLETDSVPTVEESVTALLKHVRNSLKEKDTKNDVSLNNASKQNSEVNAKTLEIKEVPVIISSSDSAEPFVNNDSQGSKNQIERTISNTEVPVITCFFEKPLDNSASALSPKSRSLVVPYSGKENKNTCSNTVAFPEDISSINCHKLKSSVTNTANGKTISPRRNRSKNWNSEESRSSSSSSYSFKDHRKTREVCLKNSPGSTDKHAIMTNNERLQTTGRLSPAQHFSKYEVWSTKSKNNFKYSHTDRIRERETQYNRTSDRPTACDKSRKRRSIDEKTRERRTQRGQSPERRSYKNESRGWHRQRDRSREKSHQDILQDDCVRSKIFKERYNHRDKSPARVVPHERTRTRRHPVKHKRSPRLLVDRARSCENVMDEHAYIPSENKSPERNSNCLLFEDGVLVSGDRLNIQPYDNCEPPIIDTLSITQDPINDQQDLSVSRSDFVEESLNRRPSNEFSDYHSATGSDNYSLWSGCESIRSESLDYFDNKFTPGLGKEQHMDSFLHHDINELSDHQSVISIEDEHADWSGSDIINLEAVNYMKTKLFNHTDSRHDMELDNIVASDTFHENELQEVAVFGSRNNDHGFVRKGRNRDSWRERKRLASNSSRWQNSFHDGKRKKPF